MGLIGFVGKYKGAEVFQKVSSPELTSKSNSVLLYFYQGNTVCGSASYSLIVTAHFRALSLFHIEVLCSQFAFG